MVREPATGRYDEFLSTLSLRRATTYLDNKPTRTAISIHALLAESDYLGARKPRDVRYFYPRSPCGERQIFLEVFICVSLISIHALLAESDAKRWNSIERPVISIHALLAESDHGFLYGLPKEHLFLSTLSLRRATACQLLLK